jgi:hypothetical protein
MRCSVPAALFWLFVVALVAALVVAYWETEP